jgi:hypothetical protein
MKSVRFLLAMGCFVWLLFSCKKEYSNETPYQKATGSLYDSTGNCIYDRVAGTFYAGITPDPDTNYIEIKVNVTSIGAYTISTDLQNGLQFANTGVFTKTGINTILLKPVGKPIHDSITTFTASFDSSFCTISIDFKDTVNSNPVTVFGWQFSTADETFRGTLDTAYFGDSALWQQNGKILNITGFTSSKRDSALVIWIYLTYGNITPGTFTTYVPPQSNNASYFYFFKNVSNSIGTAIFESSGATGTNIGTNITITLAPYDSNKNIVSGTFSGTAEIFQNGYDTGKTTDITDGSFTVSFHQ